RFHQIPTYGLDTIRHFSNNVSKMKQMAARNFEDLLQNMIPAVEGLLPEPHNGKLMTLLFHLAEWHAIAKLRMHMDFTLTLLTQSTTTIGKELCSFAEWTQTFNTVELPREADGRGHQWNCRKLTSITASGIPTPPPTLESESQMSKTKPSSTLLKAKPTKPVTASSTANPLLVQEPESQLPKTKPPVQRLKKVFNLFIYKLHALGDYMQTIHLFGTTDSYSTQIVRF
ncbi:hypothetical protein L208DRAFT_1231621, partial [Tricholoma matsutake]